MKGIRKSSKLQLHRETLRQLGDAEMNQVGGATAACQVQSLNNCSGLACIGVGPVTGVRSVISGCNAGACHTVTGCLVLKP